MTYLIKKWFLPDEMKKDFACFRMEASDILKPIAIMPPDVIYFYFEEH